MGKTILTSKQQLLLNLLFSNHTIRDNFQSAGGIALAEYYLKHRYSEDLDFFSPEEIDSRSIQVILKSISGKPNRMLLEHFVAEQIKSVNQIKYQTLVYQDVQASL